MTGGACGGKTTTIEAVKKDLGDRVIVVPEVASQLIRPLEKGGVGIPGVDIEWSQAWQDELQQQILVKQINDENISISEAEMFEEPSIVLCDRGVLDGAVYMAGGLEKFLEKFHLEYSACISRYDAIIHLNSLAVDDPEKFIEFFKSNSARHRQVDKAALLDKAIFEVWKGHQNHLRVASTEEMEEKIELVLSEIRKELERVDAELGAEIGSEGKLGVI